MTSVKPVLMFFGANRDRAREAVCLYESALPDVVIVDETSLGNGLVRCEFTIRDASVIAFDSAIDHDFALTPAVSLWVEMDSALDVERAGSALATGGRVHMPFAAYGCSHAFTWVDDPYGVSWQLAVTAVAATR